MSNPIGIVEMTATHNDYWPVCIGYLVVALRDWSPYWIAVHDNIHLWCNAAGRVNCVLTIISEHGNSMDAFRALQQLLDARVKEGKRDIHLLDWRKGRLVITDE